MNLDHLLQAGLELEKRIAQDQALRRCFSQLWRETDPKKNGASTTPAPDSNESGFVTLELPLEMCRQLDEVSKRTGQTPAQILLEGFALYCRAQEKQPKR